MNKDNSKGYEDLMIDVSKHHIFKDDKQFVDLIPKSSMQEIITEYKIRKNQRDFCLKDFIENNFSSIKHLVDSEEKYQISDPKEYIKLLWRELRQNSNSSIGSSIELPNDYIVPGGRFAEQYYWDSYFIMLGLEANEEWSLIESILDNIVYMINKFGFIPTANRIYFLSRSQPPFFSQMVELLSRKKGDGVYKKYLPSLLTEHDFWMKGIEKNSDDSQDVLRVVRLENDEIMNRYYDTTAKPRPESLGKDLSNARDLDENKLGEFYINIRAAAESGWDFSSRWFEDGKDIKTIQTTDIIPIDLNCLLFLLEKTIYKACLIDGRHDLSEKFEKLYIKRENLIQKYLWDSKSGFYYDYNFRKKCLNSQPNLAVVFPLYAKIADEKQAYLVAKTIKKKFLKKGGLVTTLINSGEQWDSPNGWAPLHWVTIIGLRNYGYDKLADEIKRRWIRSNLKILKKTGKLSEKYNVININKLSKGGEYNLQIGFGWTNGVLAALLDDKDLTYDK